MALEAKADASVGADPSVVDALRQVPVSWTEGAAALGINRCRALWTIGIRAARPAIVAAAVLASARALGEAIMLSMVSGSIGFAPNCAVPCRSTTPPGRRHWLLLCPSSTAFTARRHRGFRRHRPR